jgi:hypothetical protein
VPVPPVGQFVGMRIEMRAEPAYLIKTPTFSQFSNATRIMVTKLVSMAAHDPMARSKSLQNLLMDHPSQAVVRLVRDVTVAFVDIDKPIGK